MFTNAPTHHLHHKAPQVLPSCPTRALRSCTEPLCGVQDISPECGAVHCAHATFSEKVLKV